MVAISQIYDILVTLRFLNDLLKFYSFLSTDLLIFLIQIYILNCFVIVYLYLICEYMINS